MRGLLRNRQNNTETWVSFPGRLVPSHPCLVPSFLPKNSAPEVHYYVSKREKKKKVKPESNIQFLLNVLFTMPRRQSQYKIRLFLDLNCPLELHRVFCEHFKSNRMDYNTLEKIL